ncbi:hypothetical protein MRB53_023464 [Persea americana]|uniref:Uncharacterized protein n=1 Tax=Persea americana TaxID=3435 RepID=A0ACC2LAC0_PERAE|nr:hypothetical protein MRB53_023464 [Persea americana]
MTAVVNMAIHGYTIKVGFELLVNVFTALVDMYAKCGLIEIASDYGAWNGLPFAFPSQMDNLRDKSKTAMVSHVQMGSLDGKSEHEFEDESLVSPLSLARKTHGFDVAQHISFSGGLQPLTIKYMRTKMITSIKSVVFSTKLNLLMPFGPIAILVHNYTGHHGWVFFLSLLGITPLAERLGYATEQLAFYTGPTAGGLLNATFGNATELIISIYALRSGMIRVVQQSLLGSILSNMLLVLGCAFFSGGIVFCTKEQIFNRGSAVVNSGLLLMAVMGLTFPAVLHFTHTELHFGESELALSRFSSCIMLVAYGSYLFFQLKSQKNLYSPVDEEESQNEEDNADDDEAPEISKMEAIIWLAIMTIWISYLSGYLVDAIEGASVAWKMPVAFISVILLPIVGNAAEHASAIIFAMKDKLDISLGVAIGSSTQIAMFGIPFCVVVGWIMGRPMDLNFQLFETATLFITVLVVAFMLQEGTSNYFKGLMLILCYLIVAASFFVHVDPLTVVPQMVSSRLKYIDGILGQRHWVLTQNPNLGVGLNPHPLATATTVIYKLKCGVALQDPLLDHEKRLLGRGVSKQTPLGVTTAIIRNLNDPERVNINTRPGVLPDGLDDAAGLVDDAAGLIVGAEYAEEDSDRRGGFRRFREASGGASAW